MTDTFRGLLIFSFGAVVAMACSATLPQATATSIPTPLECPAPEPTVCTCVVEAIDADRMVDFEETVWRLEGDVVSLQGVLE